MSGSSQSESLAVLHFALCGVTQKHLDELEHRVEMTERTVARRVAREESRCGFFAFVLTAAPRYLSMIETLRADHRRLTSALSSLRTRIQRADPSQWEDLKAEADAIDAAIDEHEALERAILEDALSPT